MAAKNKLDIDLDTDPKSLVAVREFNAPREIVFEAWTDPAHLSQWWGPQGFSTTTSKFELKNGGIWRFVMHSADGTNYENRITFEKVERPKRIVYSHGGGDKIDEIDFRVVVTFDEIAATRTRLTFRMDFASAAERAEKIKFGADKGLNQTLSRLEEFVSLSPLPKINPETDLVLERVVDVPPELVWLAWTTPEHIAPWFCPKPWSVSDVRIDLRPGGEFSCVMHGPNGESFPNAGCYLEVVPNRRLIWTDSLAPGFRPVPKPFFTGIIKLEPFGKGTRYTAIALHSDGDTAKRHAEMGFHDGWGTVLTQLVDYIKSNDELKKLAQPLKDWRA